MVCWNVLPEYRISYMEYGNRDTGLDGTSWEEGDFFVE